jgi:hypothetical protein
MHRKLATTMFPTLGEFMSDNPFKAPRAVTNVSTAEYLKDELKKIAMFQRSILVCLLAQLILAAIMFSSEIPGLVFLLVPLKLLTLVLGIMLALKFHEKKTLYIIVAILTLLPSILGLIMLAFLNQATINILKGHGIRIGFFGADSKSI